MAPRLLLVGCGKMGGAMLTGWLERASAAETVVVEPAAGAVAEFAGAPSVRSIASADEIPPDYRPDVIVLAVKPHSMDEVAPAYRRFVAAEPAYLSIAAGKPIGYFADRLGTDAAIVRAMPNTPAAVGRGITVLCASANVAPEQKATCQALMEAVGEVAWVEDESLMDAVTAVSGSGPAYVFLLIESLAQAGIAAGLPPDLAHQLARATVAGSGELALRSSESAATLRQNVTSPGGTTAAALEILMAPDGLDRLMKLAVNAAARRSRELAG